MSTFQTKTGEVSFVQYYKQQYNIEIKDLKQPLLISREDKRVSGQKEKVSFTFSIVPEISFLTGLSDEQRADFKVILAIPKPCSMDTSSVKRKYFMFNFLKKREFFISNHRLYAFYYFVLFLIDFEKFLWIIVEKYFDKYPRVHIFQLTSSVAVFCNIVNDSSLNSSRFSSRIITISKFKIKHIQFKSADSLKIIV